MTLPANQFAGRGWDVEANARLILDQINPFGLLTIDPAYRISVRAKYLMAESGEDRSIHSMWGHRGTRQSQDSHGLYRIAQAT